MTQDSLSFDNLPQAVLSLTALVKQLSHEVSELRGQLLTITENAKQSVTFVGIDDACRILGRSKSTVYGLAREGKLPAYKGPGEKEWRFIEEELVNNVRLNKSIASPVKSFEDMAAELSKRTRSHSH